MACEWLIDDGWLDCLAVSGLFVMVEMAVLEGHHPVLYIHGLLAHPLCLCEGGDATPAFLTPRTQPSLSATALFVLTNPAFAVPARPNPIMSRVSLRPSLREVCVHVREEEA